MAEGTHAAAFLLVLASMLSCIISLAVDKWAKYEVHIQEFEGNFTVCSQ